MKHLLLLLLVACATEDDAPPDPEDCCWYWPFEDKVRACVRERIEWGLYQQDAEGCVLVTCHPVIIDATVTVCPS